MVVAAYRRHVNTSALNGDARLARVVAEFVIEAVSRDESCRPMAAYGEFGSITAARAPTSLQTRRHLAQMCTTRIEISPVRVWHIDDHSREPSFPHGNFDIARTHPTSCY